MFVDYMAVMFVFMLLFTFVVAFLCLPIMIANARGIRDSKKTAIVFLALMGALCGITWLVALILALVWRGAPACDCGASPDLDGLEKLAKLYKSRAITKSEYEKMKAKLIAE